MGDVEEAIVSAGMRGTDPYPCAHSAHCPGDHHGVVCVREVIEACGEHDLRKLAGVYALEAREIEVRPARDSYSRRYLCEAVVAGARHADDRAFNGVEDERSRRCP